jgi:hypothetical protein
MHVANVTTYETLYASAVPVRLAQVDVSRMSVSEWPVSYLR